MDGVAGKIAFVKTGNDFTADQRRWTSLRLLPSALLRPVVVLLLRYALNPRLRYIRLATTSTKLRAFSIILCMLYPTFHGGE